MTTWIKNNSLFELAKQGQRITPWWAVLLVSIAILVLSSIFSLPVVIIQIVWQEVGGFAENSSLPAVFLSLTLSISFGSMILLVWLWVKLYEKRSFATLGFLRHNALFQYGRGFLLGFLAFLGAVGLMAVFGFIQPASEPVGLAGAAALPAVLLVLMPGWIVQGAAEEVLTRGWMMSALAARYKAWIGIVISSIFFGVMHGLNPNLSLLAMINLILYGLFAAFYALREQSLWGICAFHSVWNWTQGNIFGLSVSGQQTGIGSLFNLVENGPDWFTGGAFGPEGGFAVTLMLLFSILLIVLWPRTNVQSFALHTPSLSTQDTSGKR